MKQLLIFCGSLLLYTNYTYAQNSLSIADTRESGTTPDTYNRNLLLNFKRTDTLQIPGLNPSFVALMGMRPWVDNSGGKAHELAFASNNQIYVRSGLSPAWESWRRLLVENAGGNVGIGTLTPAYNLDVNGTANATTLSLNKKLVLTMPSTNTERGAFNPIWLAVRSGRKLFVDEQFASNTNSIIPYTLSENGSVTIARLTDVGLPSNSGYYLEFKHMGNPTPGFGGFRQTFTGRVNGTYVHVMRAKLPVGYMLTSNSNSIGTGGTKYWLTNNEGTGKWEDYAYVIQYGNGGTMSTAGYVFIDGGPAPTTENPLIWQLASSTIFDVTHLNDGEGSRVNADMLDSLHAKDFLKNQITEDQVASFRISGNGFVAGNIGVGVTDTKGYKLAVGGSMVAESIKVKLKTAWPDYVFAPAYKLPSLQEVEDHIKQHQHLPGMPSAKEVAAEGIDLGEMNRKLLQKVEELTLYIIELRKEVNALKQK